MSPAETETSFKSQNNKIFTRACQSSDISRGFRDTGKFLAQVRKTGRLWSRDLPTINACGDSMRLEQRFRRSVYVKRRKEGNSKSEHARPFLRCSCLANPRSRIPPLRLGRLNGCPDWLDAGGVCQFKKKKREILVTQRDQSFSSEQTFY